ncbi:DUF4406 domain-containing protein [Erysipelotrichaceae bacterium 51-3]
MQKNKVVAMISQPMGGLSDEAIITNRAKAEALLDSLGFDGVNTLFTDDCADDEAKNRPLVSLAKSLEMMAKADIAIFCPGWEKARGCQIEYQAAKAYGIPCIALI